MFTPRMLSRSPARLAVASVGLALVAAAGPPATRPVQAGPDRMIDVMGGRLGRDALARDINGAGQLAGSFIARDGAYHAFFTVGRKAIDLGPGDAHAINDHGQVVGVAHSVGEFHAFLYDGAGMHILGEPAGGTASIAYDINDRGQVVGQWQGPDVRGYRPFLWDESGVRDLGTLGGDYARALAINDEGQIVGESWTPTDLDHPFLYDDAGLHDLRPVIGAAAGDEWTIDGLEDINDQGQVIGTMHPTAGGTGQAFRFDLVTAGFTALEPLVAGEFVFPSDINDAGEIVGWARPPAGIGTVLVHAVLWDGGPVRDLGTLGGASSFAYAIDEAGMVVGGADTRSGARHAFTLLTR